MSRYRVTREARRDLEDVWFYISADDLRAADRWVSRMEERFRVLAAQPRAGQARPDLAPGLRFLPFGNYLIFHRPLEDGVEIVRVIHGARDYGPADF